MTRLSDLLAYLCDSQPHLLGATLQGWMDVSPRFTVFVETYRDKIRKKLRVTPDPERNARLGWLVLGIAMMVFVANTFGYASQITGMQQSIFDDEDVYIWNVMLGQMTVLWLAGAIAEIYRLTRQRGKSAAEGTDDLHSVINWIYRPQGFLKPLGSDEL